MAEVEGIGSKFEYANTGATLNAATGWTELAEVTELTLPDPQAGDIKTTHMGITDHHHTYQAGMVEPGTFEVTCHYSPTVHSTLDGLRRTDKLFRVRFSDGSAVAWGGYINHGPTEEIDIEGLTVLKFGGKVSGAITPVASIS